MPVLDSAITIPPHWLHQGRPMLGRSLQPLAPALIRQNEELRSASLRPPSTPVEQQACLTPPFPICRELEAAFSAPQCAFGSSSPFQVFAPSATLRRRASIR